MRILSKLTLLTIISINAHGQLSEAGFKEAAFGLSILTGYHHVAVTDLNSFLNDNNLKEIKAGYLNLGAGLNYKLNRHFIQFAGDVDINEDTKYNESNVGTSSYSYSVNINYGYEFNLFDQLKLVPYLGASRTIFKTKISDGTQSTLDFQSITTDRNSISVDNDTFSLILGSRFLVPLGDWEFSYCGLDFNYGFKTNSTWTMNEAKVSNAPTINPSGLKIGIILMFMIGH